MKALIMLVLMTLPALAQQQFIPLTDWRAAIDLELSRVPMTREAHGQVMGIMQNAERNAHPAPAPGPLPQPERKPPGEPEKKKTGQ